MIIWEQKSFSSVRTESCLCTAVLLLFHVNAISWSNNFSVWWMKRCFNFFFFNLKKLYWFNIFKYFCFLVISGSLSGFLSLFCFILFDLFACHTDSSLNPSAGPQPFLHLPTLQCDPVECRWVLLLCCGHCFNVGHIHSYLFVHHQKGELCNIRRLNWTRVSVRSNLKSVDWKLVHFVFL